MPVAQETFFQFDNVVLPGEPEDFGRDPWFDRPFDKLTVLSKVEGLTTLSEAEGESREVAEYQIILDPGSHPAPRDLAGMTNYDKDTTGHETEAIMEKITGPPKNIELFLVF
ncbi:MAG: hypothetical protein AMK69_04175 [Nitrospira bacterium SG8_3]|nr:MAG: hypothetical protein AMK69_04175 [Nitrospira bacterium SG8_3]